MLGDRARVEGDAVGSLERVPAEVRPARALHALVVDLLPGILADVADDEVARSSVEGEPERVAEAVGEDLPAAAALAGEGVRARDRVALLALAVRIDPQHLAE